MPLRQQLDSWLGSGLKCLHYGVTLGRRTKVLSQVLEKEHTCGMQFNTLTINNNHLVVV